MRKLPVLWILIVLALCVPAFAQAPQIGRATIRLANGNLFIDNGEKKSFTLEFTGKDVVAQTVGDNPAFAVDGKLIQILVVENKSFLNGVKASAEDKILEMHRDWEADYLQKEVYKAEFKAVSEMVTVSGRQMLFWGFTRPNANNVFDRDYFISTVMGDELIGLSAPLKKGESVDDYKKAFLQIMSTLKISDKPIDILKLAEELKAVKKN